MVDPDRGDGSFFGRWTQRKVQARKGDLPADVSTNLTKPSRPSALDKPAAAGAQVPVGQSVAATGAGSQSATPAEPSPPPPPPPPTLEDVAKLTTDSDYSAFAARTVDSRVRNAAMRKLFAGDPPFNLMDGLDVYIDDYSVGESIPQSMLRQMVQARSLGLLDDELVDQDKPSLAELPTKLAANDTAIPHENTDLQLQRNDAAGHSGAADRAKPAEAPAEEPRAGRNSGIDTHPGVDPLDHRHN